MLRTLVGDPEMREYSFDCYAYPTKIFRPSLGAPLPGIQEIANGLRTFIATHHSDKSAITLVGHSLGGLVARQFILDAFKESYPLSIAGALLYATPNTGASLASVGWLSSWRNRHLRQLRKQSDLLKILNQDWIRFRIEEKFRVLYVIGGKDGVVDSNSASWQVAAANVATLIEHGHVSIKEPIDASDIRYKVMKDFILGKKIQLTVEANEHTPANAVGDVLFDIYSRTVEEFYIVREDDRLLSVAANSAHIWVSGRSGVGKTAALRRLAERADWKIHHISLGSYLGFGSDELLLALANELCDRASLPARIGTTVPSLHEVLAQLRKALSHLANERPIAIIVEEIPLANGPEFTSLLRAFGHIASASETDGTKNRVVWLFASINDPRPDLPPASAKFLERVQLLTFDSWTLDDSRRLVELIDRALHTSFNKSDREQLASAARGNPRFIKSVFRRKRNELNSQKALSDLIESVQADC